MKLPLMGGLDKEQLDEVIKYLGDRSDLDISQILISADYSGGDTVYYDVVLRFNEGDLIE